MYEATNDQSKREFYYHERYNNRNKNIENDDSTSRYKFVRYVVLKSHIINGLLLTSIAWSLRENIGSKSINVVSWKPILIKTTRLYTTKNVFTLFIFSIKCSKHNNGVLLTLTKPARNLTPSILHAVAYLGGGHAAMAPPRKVRKVF